MAVKFVEVISSKGTTTVVRGDDGEIYTLKGGAGGTESRNNNPGALKYGPRAQRFGAIGQTAAPPGSPDGLGYAIFPTYTDGVLAYADLQQQRHANSTIEQMIKSYAVDEALPAYGKYADDLARAAGVSKNTRIGDLTAAQFAALQAKQFEIEGAGTGRLTVTDSKGRKVDITKTFGPRMVPEGAIPTVATQVSIPSGSDSVKAYQQQLKNAGFDPGVIDGIAGTNTKAAVRAFQQAHGLAVDGIVGPQTLAALNRLNTVPASSSDPSKRGTTVASGSTATYNPVSVTVGGVSVAVRPTAQSIKNAVAPVPAGHDQMFAARSQNFRNVNPDLVPPNPAGHDQMFAARNPVSPQEKLLSGFGAIFGLGTAIQGGLQGLNSNLPLGEQDGFGSGSSGPLNRGRPTYRGQDALVAPIPAFGRPQLAPIPATRSSMIAPVPKAPITRAPVPKEPLQRSPTPAPASQRPSSPTASQNRPIGETRVGSNGYVYTNTASGWKQTGTTRAPGVTPSQQYESRAAPARQSSSIQVGSYNSDSGWYSATSGSGTQSLV